MTKEEKDILKKLKKEENYDEIFKQFGQKQFSKNVSRKYKKQDIKKLKKEGKFEDVYLRYGKSQYNRLLNQAKQREIEEVYGKRSAKAIGNKIKTRVKSAFGALLIGTGMLSGAGTLALGTAIYQSEQLKSEEKAKYEEIIKDYEDGVKEYAENIKAMGLTDLEIFMKLQADMHNSIKGYGTPSLDIFGYEGADMAQEDGMGVCRNMANDIMNKLNAIDSKYNARSIMVKSEGCNLERVDIQKNSIKSSENVSKINKMPMIKTINNAIVDLHENGILDARNLIDNMYGNHLVVLIDLKEENTTLIVDPTEVCLGVFLNGEIVMFNSLDMQEPYKLHRRIVGDLFYRGKSSLEVPSEYIKSFLNPNETIEELKEKYSVEAQQKALDSANEKELKYIYNSRKRNFRNSIKVDLKEQEEKIYSIEEIQNLYNELIPKASSITNKEEAIEIANAYRKITCEVLPSIEYYNKKQEDIIGKSVNEYAKVGDNLNLEVSNDLRQQIVKKMIETDAVNLPIGEDTTKEFLCDAYLQTEPQKQLQDLRVAFDILYGYHILDNEDNFLAVVKIGYMEDTYTKYEPQDKKLEEIWLGMAKPIVKEVQRDANKEIDER